MAELARRRRARDIWISRSHLGAGAVGLALIALLSGFAGVHVGRAQAQGVATAQAGRTQLSEGDLIALIARVEATAVTEEAVEHMTFPDALAGRMDEVQLPHSGEVAAPAVRIDAASGPARLDVIPPGQQTVEAARFEQQAMAVGLRDALRDAGHQAWLGLEIIDGHSVHVVLVEAK